MKPSRIVTATLIALALALCVSTYSVFGHTWDEPEHLAAGMQLLDRGLYTYDIQHPPLARLAIALGPYLAGARAYGEPGPSGEQEGRDLLYRSGDYDGTLTLARLGVLPFLALLLGAAWAWARRQFDERVATVAVFFLATAPTLLGHASLAALDVPGAALCTIALLSMVRWLESPSGDRSLVLGLTSGLAVGTKLSAIPFLLVSAIAIWAVRVAFRPGEIAARHSSAVRPWASGACIAVVAALATLCVVYGGQFEYLTGHVARRSEALDFLAGASGVAHDFLYRFCANFPVPVALEKLTLGVKALEKHNREGHLSFLLGEAKKTGWWYFYLVALTVKSTLPLLVLGLTGFGLMIGRAIRDRMWQPAAPAIFFAAILGFCCIYSRINIGVRHVLVLFPLLALGAGVSLMRLWGLRNAVLGKTLVVAVVAWQLSTLWRAWPDYLPYFNELVRRPEQVLIDSDLDWGQDMRRLERSLRERKVQNFSFVFRGTEDWIREDFPPFTFLPPNLETTGWVAVDVLAKFLLTQGRDGYAWLDPYRPVARIGKTIDLYYIPQDERPAAR
jgi:Dolichyl-phosphate-mannose-protein mannosyltransferase